MAKAKPAPKKPAPKAKGAKPPKAEPATKQTKADAKKAAEVKAKKKATAKKAGAGGPPPKRQGRTDAEKQAARRSEPKPIDYKSPKFLAAYDAETAATGSKQVAEIDSYEREWKAAHEKASALKKQFESARSLHIQYVRERNEHRGKPPGHLFASFEAQQTVEKFGHVPAPGAPAADSPAKPLAETAAAAAGPMSLPDGAKPSSWFPDDLWKKFPIDRLTGYGLTAADAEKFKAGENKQGRENFPIHTMGDLTAYQSPTASGFERRLSDIKGIGAATADRLEKACNGFWKDWPGLSEAFAVEMGYRRQLTDPEPKPAETPAADQGATGETRPGADGDNGSAGNDHPPGEPAPTRGKRHRKRKAEGADAPAGAAGGDGPALPFPEGDKPDGEPEEKGDGNLPD